MESILFRPTEAGTAELSAGEPSCFPDLNLDQLIDTVTAGRREYDLASFFYTLLPDADDVLYRHEVFQDLEKEQLLEGVESFAARMRTMRQHLALAEKLRHRYEKKRWFLEAIDVYCDAVSALARDLAAAAIGSRGFSALREYLRTYTQAESFRSLQSQTKELKEDLSRVRYNLLIDGLTVKVLRYDSQADYASEVETTFARFRHDPQDSYLVELRSWINLNHVEERVLDYVARLFPDIFARLDAFCDGNPEFPDPAITRFDREVHFYLSYLASTAALRQAGLQFCYPEVSGTRTDTYAHGAYDLPLAYKLLRENGTVVDNDFCFEAEEQVFVVTGPNQGGKTTFARTVGQLHFLAALGCPVPGTEARLLLTDGVYTHFGKEENMAELRGRLEDDLLRIHAILNQVTSRSLIIMNEIFTSTAIQDALFLSRRILDSVCGQGALAVFVTFLDELAAADGHTVSMVAAVDPDDPMVRTFKILRRPADGLAYALSVAASHRLSYELITKRVQP